MIIFLPNICANNKFCARYGVVGLAEISACILEHIRLNALYARNL